jgi:hypothetical protein
MKPPPLPEVTLQRVLRVAKLNAWSVVIVAGICLPLSAVLGDWSGTAACALVVFGGWTELAGRRQVAAGDAAGVNQLIRAQWIVLGTILVYCVARLASFDADTALGNLTPSMRSELASSGIDVEAILPLVRMVFYMTYTVVIVVTAVYQGGLARYYSRRRTIVGQALADRLRPAGKPASSERVGPAPEDLVT